MMRARAFWRRHFLHMEATVAALPPLVLLIWFVWLGGTEHVDDFITGVRTDLYRTTATVAGTLLGFSIAVASLVLNFVSAERLALLRTSEQYPSLWTTFFQTTRLLGALTLAALVCLVVDKDVSPVTWVIIPFSLFVSLAGIRLLRVIWILEQIIKLVSRTESHQRLFEGSRDQ